MASVKVTPTDNGPYVIEGPARVVDADGNEYDLTEQTTIFLCRCGGSGTKPFCDGTHETLKFEAVSRAPHTPWRRSPSHPERDARTARLRPLPPAGRTPGYASPRPRPAGLINAASHHDELKRDRDFT